MPAALRWALPQRDVAPSGFITTQSGNQASISFVVVQFFLQSIVSFRRSCVLETVGCSSVEAIIVKTVFSLFPRPLPLPLTAGSLYDSSREAP